MGTDSMRWPDCGCDSCRAEKALAQEGAARSAAEQRAAEAESAKASAESGRAEAESGKAQAERDQAQARTQAEGARLEAEARQRDAQQLSFLHQALSDKEQGRLAAVDRAAEAERQASIQAGQAKWAADQAKWAADQASLAERTLQQVCFSSSVSTYRSPLCKDLQIHQCVDSDSSAGMCYRACRYVSHVSNAVHAQWCLAAQVWPMSAETNQTVSCSAWACPAFLTHGQLWWCAPMAQPVCGSGLCSTVCSHDVLLGTT